MAADTYVVLYGEGYWGDMGQGVTPGDLAVLAASSASALCALGYQVSFRPTHPSEVEGTYQRMDDGSLQILGYSLEVPPDLSDALEDTWSTVLRDYEVTS